MVWLAALVALGVGGTALGLLLRLQGTIRRTRSLLCPEGICPPDLEPLERVLRIAIDESLMPALRQPDPALIELTHREHQDPYRTLADVLTWIRQNSEVEKQAPLEDIIKAICQVGYTLGQPGSTLETCLQPFADRLQRLLAPSRGEVKIVYVQPGELIETSRMMPLSYGSRVQYPLGVVVLDASGQVLSKARVLAA